MKSNGTAVRFDYSYDYNAMAAEFYVEMIPAKDGCFVEYSEYKKLLANKRKLERKIKKLRASANKRRPVRARPVKRDSEVDFKVGDLVQVTRNAPVHSDCYACGDIGRITQIVGTWCIRVDFNSFDNPKVFQDGIWFLSSEFIKKVVRDELDYRVL